jgi:hypothetical protein
LTWGVGNLEWGGNGEGDVSLRATWGQGGRDRITPKEGFQVSKGNGRGVNKEPARGVKKGNCAIALYCQSVYVYIITE